MSAVVVIEWEWVVVVVVVIEGEVDDAVVDGVSVVGVEDDPKDVGGKRAQFAHAVMEFVISVDLGVGVLDASGDALSEFLVDDVHGTVVPIDTEVFLVLQAFVEVFARLTEEDASGPRQVVADEVEDFWRHGLEGARGLDVNHGLGLVRGHIGLKVKKEGFL